MRKVSCKAYVYVNIFIWFWFVGMELIPLLLGNNFIGIKGILGQIQIAIYITLLSCLIYGIACLLAKPLRDTSNEEPWKPSKDFHIDVWRGDEKDKQETKK